MTGILFFLGASSMAIALVSLVYFIAVAKRDYVV